MLDAERGAGLVPVRPFGQLPGGDVRVGQNDLGDVLISSTVPTPVVRRACATPWTGVRGRGKSSALCLIGDVVQRRQDDVVDALLARGVGAHGPC